MKTYNLWVLSVILVCAGQPVSAQPRTEGPVVINLRSYGWEPPDRLDHSGPLIAVDHEGRTLVGFKVRQRTGLVTRSQPSLDFHILRFSPDGKLDLSLSLPTNAKGRTGIYLSDADQIVARANESLHLLLVTDGKPQGAAWKIIAQCGLWCNVEQSVTRQTLFLYTHAADPPSTLVHLSQQPLVKQCGKPDPQSITDGFAYRSEDGDTYRWPLCDYEHRVEMALHAHTRLRALNDKLFVLTNFFDKGVRGLEVITSDGQLKFRPELAAHEWAFGYPAIRSSERGNRIAVDVVTMRGGIQALDIGNHPTARRIAVYDVEAGKESASIAAHVKYSNGFEFDLSPDGCRLAILEDGTVRLIDLGCAAKPKTH